MGAMKNPSEHEDDIDLRALFGVVLRRKYLVLAVPLAAGVITAAMTMNMTKIYEVSMFIEPPVTGPADPGTQNLDSALAIKSEIEAGAFSRKIIDDMNLPESSLRFDLVQPKDTRLIKIVLNRTGDRTASGVKILEKLVEVINFRYAKVLGDKRKRLDNHISAVSGLITTAENQIKLNSELFKMLEVREQLFLEEIKGSKAVAERLLEKITAALPQRETGDATASLFYATTMQQNAAHLTQLQNELVELRTRKDKILNAAEDFKAAVISNQIEVKNIILSRDSLRNVEVVQAPFVSPDPRPQKKKQKMLLAGAVGLILGVFSAFVFEYRENHSA